MKAHTQQRESSLAHTLTHTEPTLAEFKLDAEMTRDHNRAARAPHPRRGSTPWGYQEATPQQSGGRHGMRSRRPFGVCLRWSHQSTLRSGEAARPRACTASADRPLTDRSAPAAAFAAAPALAPGRLRTRVQECGGSTCSKEANQGGGEQGPKTGRGTRARAHVRFSCMYSGRRSAQSPSAFGSKPTSSGRTGLSSSPTGARSISKDSGRCSPPQLHCTRLPLTDTVTPVSIS